MALWEMMTNQNDCHLKRTIGCVLKPPGLIEVMKRVVRKTWQRMCNDRCVLAGSSPCIKPQDNKMPSERCSH